VSDDGLSDLTDLEQTSEVCFGDFGSLPAFLRKYLIRNETVHERRHLSWNLTLVQPKILF